MFEIGNTLREARLRRGLDILECEAETKIRAKYLRAMEEEQFDLMPSPTYVRGFLRTYAEFLDLDGQLVLDEYESRFDSFDAPDPHESRRPAGPGGHDPRPRHRSARAGRDRGGRRPRRRRSTEVQLLWLAIGGVMAVALLVWLGVGEGDAPESAAPGAAPTAAQATRAAPAPEPDNPADEGPVEPRRTTIRLTGVGDIGSYLQVRGVDADGRVVFDGILGPGQTLTYRVVRGIWMSVGNPDGLELLVNGEPAEVGGGTAAYVVDRSGVEPA